MATGEALLILGDEKAAMQRYSRALDAPGSDRVEVRLALARLFVQSGRRVDAKDQVAFAMAESRVGEATAVTAENLIDAGRIFVSINEYDLARSYFERAQKEGADQEMVNLGLANTEIALGNTRAATLLLKAVGNSDQKRVACRVAEGIVNGLEIVEIEKKHADLGLSPVILC